MAARREDPDGPEDRGLIKIHIRRRDIEVTDVLRLHVEHRVGLALGRFADRIRNVIVRFSPLEDDRSGAHKRCRIEIGLRPQRVEVEDIDADLFAAVNHATDRATRSVARALDWEAR
jgi:ribosomal subunit interface protein